jgi:hypothetical protein
MSESKKEASVPFITSLTVQHHHHLFVLLVTQISHDPHGKKLYKGINTRKRGCFGNWLAYLVSKDSALALWKGTPDIQGLASPLIDTCL